MYLVRNTEWSIDFLQCYTTTWTSNKIQLFKIQMFLYLQNYFFKEWKDIFKDKILIFFE